MKKLFLLLFLLPFTFSVFGQKKGGTQIKLEPEEWNFQPQKVEFKKTNGQQSMKLLPMAGRVVLKDFDFSVGTIEFDILPKDKTFAFVYFRYKDADESESLYFRTASAGKPYATDAVQYTPYISGVNLWDMMGHYQSDASLKNGEWNHVKLEISQSQMRMFLNHEASPSLEVSQLEGNTQSGTLAFEGEVEISNLRVNHTDFNGLAPQPGPDPSSYDPRYLRSWMVSQPISTPEKVDFSYEWMPSDSTRWDLLEAERRGLLNLTRQFGRSESRRLVWLKLVLKTDKDQERNLELGFSDEVWVFLNGHMVYLDKNLYNQPMMKKPEGRISIENTSFDLPLKAGYNDLLIGVANNFYGWGLIARMDRLDGIELLQDSSLYYYGRKVVPLPEQVLETYLGDYKQPDGKNFSIAREEKAIRISGDGLPSMVFYPEAERKFFAKEFDVQMELFEGDLQNINLVKFYENGNEVLQLELKKQ